MASPDFSDDSIKLEPKVVLALSRLARGNNKSEKSSGVSCKQIVEYLKNNYCNLDGDVESQVLTALLSCVKTGMICALENGKYLLPGPGLKGIVSACITRVSHGPKCNCGNVIKSTSKNFKKSCCMLKLNSARTKGTKKTKSTVHVRRQSKKRTINKAKATFVEPQETSHACSVHSSESGSKCNDCLKTHSFVRSNSHVLCDKCYSANLGFVAPFDKFSPREEV